MCGRYSQAFDLDALREYFGIENIVLPVGLPPRYNISPTQLCPVVLREEVKTLTLMRWGLVPSWAKDPSIGNKMINARGETLAEKPSFRTAFKKRRCAVLADGFYEWKTVPGVKAKIPMRVTLADNSPMALAGLWESWRPAPDAEWMRTFTIVTTKPNELMSTFHHRMPVILTPTELDQWIDPAQEDTAELQKLIKQYPAARMHAYEVSRLVNSPANDTEQCTLPLEAPE